MAKLVHCAKLGRELPGLDPDSPDGSRSLKMVTLIAGPQMMARVRDQISAQAFEGWKGHMLMVMNEFRLDPQSDEANRVLAQQMEAYFFGDRADIPNYVPPQ